VLTVPAPAPGARAESCPEAREDCPKGGQKAREISRPSRRERSASTQTITRLRASSPDTSGRRSPVTVHTPAPAPVAAVSNPAPRTRRCWRCKEPVELPAESGGERPRCAKCGTLQWVPA